MIDPKDAVRLIKKAIKDKQKERYAHEDRRNFRSAEMAEFHENGLQQALEILEGKTKPAPIPTVRPVRKRAPVSSKIWTTAKGEKIPIKDMDDRHLYNTLRLLRRTAEGYVHSFSTAFNPFQGEMASDDFDRMQNAVLQDPEEAIEESLERIPQYQHLVAEAQRRGMKIA